MPLKAANLPNCLTRPLMQTIESVVRSAMAHPYSEDNES